MSTSPARLAANAANAQHSTGPRTPEGRARSSQHARTHGLTVRAVIADMHIPALPNALQPANRIQQFNKTKPLQLLLDYLEVPPPVQHSEAPSPNPPGVPS